MRDDTTRPQQELGTMKLLILTAIIAVVASSPLTESNIWPWQVGKGYVYNVESYTWTRFESNSNGNAFKAQFIIRVLEPGRLEATLENPLAAQIKNQVMSKDALPSNLDYQQVENIYEPLEIFVDGGRVLYLKVPTTLPVHYENLLKGFISALQVDLSPYKHVDSFPNSFDKDAFQGLFKKMEADVTGDCETLYSVSPVSAEWHRELPEFAEDPVEITKSKNYDSCLQKVGYQFGVPDGEKDEKQLINHSSESRILVGKKGTIYKSEILSSVFVNPLLFGKQKAEVYSYVSLYLASVQRTNSIESVKIIEYRKIPSLLYKLTLNDASFTPIDVNTKFRHVSKMVWLLATVLQVPQSFPRTEFLMRFNILVSLIRTMNSERLNSLSNEIREANSTKTKTNAWVVYRDAVAQAGTITAFNEIKRWVVTKMIEGEEAAEVISSIAGVLRDPTKEMMIEIFDFVMSPEVLEQKYVNNTALLAATKIFRFNGDELFVKEKVIPRLSKELKQAVENGDSTKAQVYVRVLGNLAHPNILEVFAPYLEDKIPVTKYLRTQIVITLKTLANTKNAYVRAVLFSLLKNTAEPYEVRVAAALNIFLAYPTPEMMKIMAHMTTEDPSTQVRAVLTNSIGFAARLKDPRFAPLAKTAKSVLGMVSKEVYGYRYSTDSLIDDYTSDDEIAHFRELSYIGSENSILPVYQRASLSFRSTGWTEEDWFTLSVSDMQHLFDYIAGTFYQPSKTEPGFKYSAKKISEILNIKREHRCSLEGSLFLDYWNQQKLITFNEDDLNLIMKNYVSQVQQMVNGVEFNYTKVLSQKQVFVSFPLAAGMPFMFEYTEPTAIILKSKAKVEIGNMTTSSNYEYQFTYARNLDGKVGFHDTFGRAYATAGIVNKLQFYLPLKYSAATKSVEAILKFELPDKNVKLFHMSVSPYNCWQTTISDWTVAIHQSIKFFQRPAKVLSTDVKFGQDTGTMFQIQGYSYSSDYENLNNFLGANLVKNLRSFLYQKDVALTEFNLKYIATESENKGVTFTAYHDTLYNQKYDGEMGPASAIDDVSHKARREEVIKRAASGIKSAKVSVVDVSASFDGKKKVEYIFTGALASSFVDNKAQAALFYKTHDQFNAVFKVIKPKIVPMNFQEALNNEIKVSYEADLKFGNSENVHFKGLGERSKKYTEMLANELMGKKCLEETNQKNFYQKECYKMIMKAHAPDTFKGVVTCKDLSPVDWQMIYNVYDFYKHLYTWEEQETPLKSLDDRTIHIEAQAFYYDNYVNYAFNTKYGTLRLNKVEALPHYPYAMAIYAPITNWERSRNWYTGFQNLLCTVDDNKILTFSGRSYNYSLTGSWHVVMADEANEFGNEVVILARRPREKQEEVYISYRALSGRTLEMEIKPNGVEVKTSVEKVNDGPLTIYHNENTKLPWLEYYTIVEGVQVFSINNGAIRFMYDTQRLIIFTEDHRKTTRGICGQSTTEIRDDYMTTYGLVDLPEYYGASFSLDDEYSDPKTVELKKEAKLKAYQPVIKYTNILHSDVHWSKAENGTAKAL